MNFSFRPPRTWYSIHKNDENKTIIFLPVNEKGFYAFGVLYLVGRAMNPSEKNKTSFYLVLLRLEQNEEKSLILHSNIIK